MSDKLPDDPLEILRCAQVNFDNLAHAFPLVAEHPYYKIARLQLDDGVRALEGKEVSLFSQKEPRW